MKLKGSLLWAVVDLRTNEIRPKALYDNLYSAIKEWRKHPMCINYGIFTVRIQVVHRVNTEHLENI